MLNVQKTRTMFVGDGSALRVVRAVTLRQKLQIKLAISPTRSILTPGQPVVAQILQRQVPARVPVFDRYK